MENRFALRSMLGNLLRKKGDRRPFTDSDSLVLSGRLDSIDVLEIVAYLEEEHRIEFGDRPFDQQVVDSVDEIMTLFPHDVIGAL